MSYKKTIFNFKEWKKILFRMSNICGFFKIKLLKIPIFVFRMSKWTFQHEHCFHRRLKHLRIGRQNQVSAIKKLV